MIELLRRALLAAGVAWGVWLYGWSPEALFRVEAVDFAQQFQKEYAPRKGPVFPDGMSMAKEFVRRNTNPGSVEAYRKRELENKLLKPATAVKAVYERALSEGGLWLTPDDPLIAAHLDQIRKIREVWLVSYLPSEVSPNHFLQIRWETAPKKSRAPAELVHPHRSQGLAWMAAAILAYLLLPARRPLPGEAHRDAVMLAALDGVSVVFFGLIFYFPFHLADSAQEVLENLMGGTGFFWAVACLFLIRLFRNAAAASQRVAVSPEGLRLESLLGARMVAFHQIHRVEPLLRNQRRAGWRIHVRNEKPIDLDWSQWMDLDSAGRALSPFMTR